MPSQVRALENYGDLINELSIMFQIDHPNMVRVHEAYQRPGGRMVSRALHACQEHSRMMPCRAQHSSSPHVQALVMDLVDPPSADPPDLMSHILRVTASP